MSSIHQKTRIVYLIGELGKGGAEKQLYLMIKHMDRTLFDPIVIVFNACPDPVYFQKLQALGVTVLEIPRSITGIMKRSIFLYRTFTHLKPDIVHSWSVHDNPYAGWIGLMSGVPIRVGSLRSSLNYKGFKNLSWLAQKLCLFSTQTLVVNARSTETELLSKNYPAYRVFLLQNCIDVMEEESGKESCDPLSVFPEGSRVICSVGNLRRNKNFHIFIDGMSLMISRYPDLFGVIIGQPIPDEVEYYDDLKHQLEVSNLQHRIVLSGFQENISAIISRCFALCLLSGSEGTPNVILEAMSRKRPVIATRVGDIPLFVRHGINGYLVEPGSVVEFSEALDKLLSDPFEAETMGGRGFAMIGEDFLCTRSVQLLQSYYMERMEKVR